MASQKINTKNNKEDSYYYSSEDSEDELDRGINKSRLSSIQSSFTQTFIDSPFFNINNNIKNIKNEMKNFSSINYPKTPIKRTKSDIRLITFYKKQYPKSKPKKTNILSFFTFNYDREKYLEIKENILSNKNNKNYSNKSQKINWKLFYDIVFKDNKDYFKDNPFYKTNSSFSDFYNNNEEKNKIDNNIEKIRFKIIIDKIKDKIKKKYEYIIDEDINIANQEKIKKIVKLPEILINIKKNENNLKNLYKIGISETDKNKFIPILINKLQKKYNIYLDKDKYEKRQYFNSLSKSSYEHEYNKLEKNSKKKLNKNKVIKFENININKSFKKKYTKYYGNDNQDKNTNLNDNKKNNLKNPLLHRKSFNSHNNLINFINQKRVIVMDNKNALDIIKRKTKSSIIGFNMKNNKIFFNKNELNIINNKKKYITDDIFEKFKNNAKIIINDEILFKEFIKEYSNYEEEIYILYNNFSLYEKTYEKQEIRNLTTYKRYKDYNHCINNFLSLKNIINFPFPEKFEINNKILDNSLNLQKIINFLK